MSDVHIFLSAYRDQMVTHHNTVICHAVKEQVKHMTKELHMAKLTWCVATGGTCVNVPFIRAAILFRLLAIYDCALQVCLLSPQSPS
jgi:hypothetical protein